MIWVQNQLYRHNEWNWTLLSVYSAGMDMLFQEPVVSTRTLESVALTVCEWAKISWGLFYPCSAWETHTSFFLYLSLYWGDLATGHLCGKNDTSKTFFPKYVAFRQLAECVWLIQRLTSAHSLPRFSVGEHQRFWRQHRCCGLLHCNGFLEGPLQVMVWWSWFRTEGAEEKT